MTKPLVLSVVGTRPQFIKAAPLSRALANRDDITEVIVHTGQHYDDDMSENFFDELSIPEPAHNLGISGGSHGEMTGRMIEAIDKILGEKEPAAVVVYGDTNSTLAGALAAAKLHIPVLHVEGGLRSFNRRMPEEINRVVADHLSAQLFCPTANAVANLEREGIQEGVHHVGDVMYDAALWARKKAENGATVLDDLKLEAGSYQVATVHRAENTDSPEALSAILDYLCERAAENLVVFPVHPRTRKAAEDYDLSMEGLACCPPLGFLDMTWLVANSVGVFTDSGGLQKEAYFHRVPCVTLREETEWVETIDAGWNRLWQGPDHGPRRDIDDYGDGNAAGRIAKLIAGYLKGEKEA